MMSSSIEIEMNERRLPRFRFRRRPLLFLLLLSLAFVILNTTIFLLWKDNPVEHTGPTVLKVVQSVVLRASLASSHLGVSTSRGSGSTAQSGASCFAAVQRSILSSLSCTRSCPSRVPVSLVRDVVFFLSLFSVFFFFVCVCFLIQKRLRDGLTPFFLFFLQKGFFSFAFFVHHQKDGRRTGRGTADVCGGH